MSGLPAELAFLLEKLHTLQSTYSPTVTKGLERSEFYVASDGQSGVLVQYVGDDFLGAVMLGPAEMAWFAKEFAEGVKG